MSATGPRTPFGPEAVDEIHLPDTPLADVIAQVRFPPITALSRRDHLAAFQEAVRSDYPVLREERQLAIVVTPQGISAVPQESGGILWRLSDVDGIWALTIAPDFIALETKNYSSRSDFFARLETALVSFQEHIRPNLYDRIGVRYVNRLSGHEWLDSLSTMVRPEVYGLLGTTTLKEGPEVVTASSAIQYRLDEGLLLVRTARLAANTAYDPSIPAAPVDSWLLDLDMSTEHSKPMPFDAMELAALGRIFSERIYRYFRWSVTPELMQKAGANR